MLFRIYRRHSRECRFSSRSQTKCECPVWMERSGRQESLNTRDWTLAHRKAHDLERAEVYGATPSPIAIDKQLEAFLADAKARHLSPATLAKLKTLTAQLEAFCQAAGITTTDQLTTDVLRDFRASWEDGPIAALKKFERLRT